MKSEKYYALLGRIDELESRLNTLELKFDDDIKGEYDLKNIKEFKIDKNKMIADVKQNLSLDLENKGFFVRKAIPKNDEGSGIIVENQDKSKFSKIMIKRSKDYAETSNIADEFDFSGWFTSNDLELGEYDGYIFIVYKETVPTYFVFNKEDMNFILDQKTQDSHGRYHFYLAKDKNDQYFDHREGGLLLTGNVNAWKKIEEIVLNNL